MNITDIDQYIIDSRDFAEAHKNLKDKLENENKHLKELTISYEILERHISNVDLTNVKNAIEAKKSEIDLLANKFNQESETVKNKKTYCMQLIQNLHTVYTQLYNLEQHNSNSEVDPFMVKMNKFLYPNLSDNHQLRREPPIAGVFKSENGLVIESKADTHETPEIAEATSHSKVLNIPITTPPKVKTIDIAKNFSFPWRTD
jgi:hypothetical protein|uniref:Uncharacterized protein n=1 Tax=viral metagenome TaxID=1070528 RepID=A0A6C0BG49_9ZZZZ